MAEESQEPELNCTSIRLWKDESFEYFECRKWQEVWVLEDLECFSAAPRCTNNSFQVSPSYQSVACQDQHLEVLLSKTQLLFGRNMSEQYGSASTFALF